jgi:hypothetical protein
VHRDWRTTELGLANVKTVYRFVSPSNLRFHLCGMNANAQVPFYKTLNGPTSLASIHRVNIPSQPRNSSQSFRPSATPYLHKQCPMLTFPVYPYFLFHYNTQRHPRVPLSTRRSASSRRWLPSSIFYPSAYYPCSLCFSCSWKRRDGADPFAVWDRPETELAQGICAALSGMHSCSWCQVFNGSDVPKRQSYSPHVNVIFNLHALPPHPTDTPRHTAQPTHPNALHANMTPSSSALPCSTVRANPEPDSMALLVDSYHPAAKPFHSCWSPRRPDVPL